MNARFAALGVVLLSAFCVAAASGGPEKEKNSIKALFDGIPKDLDAAVQANPVRCDRVNDWLQEHVNGKAKTIDMRIGVTEIYSFRNKDGTYDVGIMLDRPKEKLLGDEWRVSFVDPAGPYFQGPTEFRRVSFSFTALTTAEAEKLSAATELAIKGMVKETKLSRWNKTLGPGFKGGSPPTLTILLKEVQVDGKKWPPFVPKNNFGGPFGPEGSPPPGGAKKKKGGGN